MPPRQDDRAMSDPNVMTNRHRLGAAPGKESILIAFAFEISAGPICEMRLARPVHPVIDSVNPGHCCACGKISYARVVAVAVVYDVPIVAQPSLQHFGP